MQTFLPYPSFAESVQCLDYRRLGKQRVEAKQVLQSLGIAIGGPLPEKPSSWRNHPASKMWLGCEKSLIRYSIQVCEEWRNRGYRDSLLPQFVAALELLNYADFDDSDPWWLGSRNFHAAHRSNLLRKLPEHYSKFGWTEPSDLPYVWPSPMIPA